MTGRIHRARRQLLRHRFGDERDERRAAARYADRAARLLAGAQFGDSARQLGVHLGGRDEAIAAPVRRFDETR